MDQQQHDKNLMNKTRAYVSMLTIAILMIIVSTVTITVITVLIDNTNSYKAITEANKAQKNAESCVEVAINKLKESTSYSGNETLTLDNGSCTIGTIAGSGGSNRTIQSTGTVNFVTKRLIVIVGTVNPTTIITSWTEVDTF